MKKTFFLYFLIGIILNSCNQSVDKENLKFEIHKFLVSNNDEINCYGYSLSDYNSITIDSIIDKSKYQYLQAKIELQTKLIDNQITSKDSNTLVGRKVLEIFEKEMDSLKTIFNKTPKDELYYTCYYSYPSENIGNNSSAIVLNEIFLPIECLFYLMDELEEE